MIASSARLLERDRGRAFYYGPREEIPPKQGVI